MKTRKMNSVKGTKVYSTSEGKISANTKRYQKPLQKSVEENPVSNTNRFNELAKEK